MPSPWWISWSIWLCCLFQWNGYAMTSRYGGWSQGRTSRAFLTVCMIFVFVCFAFYSNPLASGICHLQYWTLDHWKMVLSNNNKTGVALQKDNTWLLLLLGSGYLASVRNGWGEGFVPSVYKQYLFYVFILYSACHNYIKVLFRSICQSVIALKGWITSGMSCKRIQQHCEYVNKSGVCVVTAARWPGILV